MIAATDLIVRLIKVSEACDQVAFLVALEAGSRLHIKDAVGPVPVLRLVAASLDFDVVDVLRIELRSHICGDFGVRHGHAINEPAHLVPPANVQMIVHDVCARNVIGDHRQAVGAIGAGCSLYICAAQKCGGRDESIGAVTGSPLTVVFSVTPASIS